VPCRNSSYRWRGSATLLLNTSSEAKISTFNAARLLQSSNRQEDAAALGAGVNLLVEKGQKLNEIYASPMKVIRSKVKYETKSIVINVNGHKERWFTCTLRVDSRSAKVR
jgi:hypothetical protein